MMTSKPFRVAVGRLYHESNRLNPQPATEEQFEIERGELVLNASGSTLAGIVTELQGEAMILPTLSVAAPPSGLIDDDFYQRVAQEFLDEIERLQPDAVVLDLHGAGATTRLADLEGDLLFRLRALVGPAVPVGIGLDLHAHLTDAMLRNTDVCIACKENPHSDVVECGAKAARLILQTLRGSLFPVTTSARVPMILPGAGETASGPLGEIHAKARAFQNAFPEVLDVSIYNVFRYADDHYIGQVVTVMTNRPEPISAKIAKDLAGDFWRYRERFEDELLSIDEAFLRVRNEARERPYVMADMGDRILAGAPGDSVILLSAVLDEFADLRGALTMTDPASARAAIAAGVGSVVTMKVGGQITPGFRPREVTGKVLHVSDGNFTLAGPFHGGEESSLGETAVLLIGDRIYLILTSKPAFSHDPAVFTSQGIDIGGLDFVIVKSGYHFTMNFAGIATPLLVSTPGVGYYRKGAFTYEKSRFWPEHAVDQPEINVAIYGGVRMVTDEECKAA
ncbi:M81 family metallopeptidase [Rhizobium sp. YS-1r]|uniref:M81 family metallopeptidase n=1 Tax=Rhizobium sp. YS-1r TaxID=1532558 RepID=UPI0013784B7B|nr:M81 family metallopeptidase [Rhizobium sp. YS-1r]